MKRCSKCHKLKPLSEFYKHRNYRDGHRSICIVCFSEDARKQRATEPQVCQRSDEAAYRSLMAASVTYALSDFHSSDIIRAADAALFLTGPSAPYYFSVLGLDAFDPIKLVTTNLEGIRRHDNRKLDRS